MKKDGLEVDIDFEVRNKDMEIYRLRKKVRKLQKAVALMSTMIEGLTAAKWVGKHIESLMETE